jgi:uncharacterized protein
MDSARPLSLWCVSDGRVGIERQTLAVASALAELVPVERKVMRLNPGPPQVWLPPQLWPMPLAALGPAERAQLSWPWPDVWIGNGRRSIAYSLRVKAWSGGHSLVVQLQDPKVDPGRFDLVVPPLHDRLGGANVISTVGAPVWYGAAEIEAALAASDPLSDEAGAPVATRGRVVAVIGGTSKRHSLPPERTAALIRELDSVRLKGGQLWVTTSRRTPDDAVAALREWADRAGVLFFGNGPQDGPNPYLAWLARADAALVTEDSTNMITDAAFFGLPVHLLELDGGDERFDRLHALLEARGIATRAPWTPGRDRIEPVRDAMDVARAILARLQPGSGAGPMHHMPDAPQRPA